MFLFSLKFAWLLAAAALLLSSSGGSGGGFQSAEAAGHYLKCYNCTDCEDSSDAARKNWGTCEQNNTDWSNNDPEALACTIHIYVDQKKSPPALTVDRDCCGDCNRFPKDKCDKTLGDKKVLCHCNSKDLCNQDQIDGEPAPRPSAGPSCANFPGGVMIMITLMAPSLFY